MKNTLLLTVVFLFVSIPIFAQGDLSVVPRRVIFDNFNKRSETLYLTNRGSDSATYNISYLNYELDEYGQFREVPEDSIENPASKNFRVFPRRVTLAPNETQTVKLQLRRFSDLEDGEYRSHLLFRAVPREKARTTMDEIETNPDAVGISLTPIYGLTIPNIIRKGKNTTLVNIDNALMNRNEDGTHSLNFDIIKNGSMSVYGSMSIDYITGDGSVFNLGTIPGLAIYATNNLRKVNVGINREDLDFTQGKVKITFFSKEEWNNNKIIAEKVINL